MACGLRLRHAAIAMDNDRQLQKDQNRMTEPIHIEAWSVHETGDMYTAPEQRTRYLRGIVRGHPKRRDGSRILTSAITYASGRLITTESGSVYELGAPHPSYVSWAKQNGTPIDPDEPIKMRVRAR